MGDEIALLRLQLEKRDAEIRSLKQDLIRTQSHMPTSQPADLFCSNQRVNALARSQSTIGCSSSLVGEFATQNPNGLARLHRAYSQQSPTSMSRSASSRCESMPFRQTGPVSPLESLPLYRSASDQARMNHRSSHPNLANIQENDVLPGVGINPAEFIAANYREDEGTYLATTRAPSNIQFFQNGSACPSMYSGVTALDATSPMTRQNSTFDNAPNWGTEMINTASSHSMFATGSEQLLYPSMGFSQSPDASQKQLPAANHDLLGLGANLQDASPLSVYEATSFATSLADDLSASMERSTSNESTSSTASTGSNLERRAKERHRQVVENGKQVILAKPLASDASSPTAAKKKTKAVLTKSAYQRRKQPRVFCTECQDHPGGFRGDHELQRHVSAKHSTEVTKYVCRDPADVGLKSRVVPKIPLKGCKSCDSGKPYGAYYNAAAHLRRAHFVPKLIRSKTKGIDERRGGSAGGNWPPMDELKVWYEKIKVTAGSAPVSPEDDVDTPEEDEVEEMEVEAEELEPEPATHVQQQSSGLAGVTAAEWPVIVQPEMPLPESQEFMPFPGHISLENSPANLSFTEDNSPPMWGPTSSNSFASPALDFLNQESPALNFPAF